MNLFINSLGHYIPQTRIGNDYFFPLNGLTNEWIIQRTGIETRSRALEGEDTNILGEKAVRNALKKLPYEISEVDLVVSASYTPNDLVHTPSHHAQRVFNIPNAKALYVSTACSSVANAIEIIEGYFASGKASKALLIAADHNSSYSNDEDQTNGHLWGDGAVAMFLSKERLSDNDSTIIDIYTRSLGHLGKANISVNAFPRKQGISMPYGKDVFVHACKYMTESIQLIVDRNNTKLEDINYVSGHQANLRILSNTAESLNLREEQLLVNIDKVGNTGCGSHLIAISERWDEFSKGEKIVAVVFGGGYSCGSYIIEK